MQQLLSETSQRAMSYLDSLAERNVAPTPEALANLQNFDEPLPDQPSDPIETLRRLDQFGSPATVATAGPRYYGFVTGGTLPAALSAAWLASAWDNNGGLSVMSPVSAKLEEVALGWLVEILGLPAGTGGGFVTGATMANFTALCAARHALLQRQGWDVEAQGLFDAPPLTVVVGDEVHVSVLKALAMVGLGRERVVRVPVDGQGRMRADALPQLNERTILITQAGNVNTGACDPIGEICERAKGSGAWVHVDGAFGLWAAATPNYAHLVQGVGEADSWATDGHKWHFTKETNGYYFCTIVFRVIFCALQFC